MHDQLADFGRSRERQLAHEGMPRQCGAAFLAVPGQQVDHAPRQVVVAELRDTKQSEPDKPWYLWFCPGANHAPHHAPQEFIDKYKGKFDDGYEAYRDWALARMVEKGVLPEGTDLTPINPLPEGTHSPLDDVRPWDTLSDDEKRLFARMAEVYAGFSEYTDHQVGRIVDYLEESGQLDMLRSLRCRYAQGFLFARPMPSDRLDEVYALGSGVHL